MTKLHSMPFAGYYTYLSVEGNDLFTMVALPEEGGRFPLVLYRDPYVERFANSTEEETLLTVMQVHRRWLENGYGVVYQHCRGHGKSTGDTVAYIYEREDGLALQEWVRQQPFYNGELYLCGQSYLASVHFVTAPYAPDIKGAVLEVQDCERYNIAYRHGTFRIGLHGSWYIGMYKPKSGKPKYYASDRAYEQLPLRDFPKMVFGEPAPDLEEMLRHPDPRDDFWKDTRFGGNDARHAIENATIPILYTSSAFDLYVGGIYEAWMGMPKAQRDRCALVISAYDHGDSASSSPIFFPNGTKAGGIGADYAVAWVNAIRGKGAYPAAPGKVTYYRLFDNKWATDDFIPDTTLRVALGEETRCYHYNPYDPPSFKGGLSGMFGGTAIQDAPNFRPDVVTVYTALFERDTMIKGEMTAHLTVSSDCEDTGFCVRVSVTTQKGDYGLREDITNLCFQHPDYVPGEKAGMDFTFDAGAFLVKKGERLRVDVASADAAHYVRHTNQKGLFSEQATAKVAVNTVYFGESTLTLPVETDKN